MNFFLTERGVQMFGTSIFVWTPIQTSVCYELCTAFAYNGSEIEAQLKVDAVILVYTILSIFVSYLEDCVIVLFA